jgi:hypothetical protein
MKGRPRGDGDVEAYAAVFNTSVRASMKGRPRGDGDRGLILPPLTCGAADTPRTLPNGHPLRSRSSRRFVRRKPLTGADDPRCLLRPTRAGAAVAKDSTAVTG